VTAQRRHRLTPEQRSMRARLAAQARWARTPRAIERRAATAAARRARREQFERQVLEQYGDELTSAELAAAVASLQAAHMTRMACASSRTRHGTDIR
jgi:hypothetical protein